ncbi:MULTISPECIES: VTT domain-containing protein [unclassified Limnobacter]|jgi:membrane protein DedA with SNARE-associated domain/rhodanese-related sulfurtransferase|uniref:VTT domain-containing protein n=1 Tax=unclassified Limnobacter TaxID=2630203 RepID=UPI000156C05B|nr:MULTISPECIES: VTT domain-containing protein [unclassified Limnobacter]EDM82546.1 DedA [Limnobacter sp. MED105]
MSLFETTEVLVFFNVLLQQLGAPVPAVPTMILSASLSGQWSGIFLLAVVATSASLIADWAWYIAGRYYGYRVLSVLCKLSINPESCVSQTESRFRVWGPWSLVVAKFIPGFSTVAPPIAGAVKMSILSFTIASALGAFLWAMAALLAGWLFKDQVNAIYAALQDNLFIVGVVAALICAFWLMWKLARRDAFQARLKLPKMPAAEVLALVKAGQSNLRLVDLRPAMVQEAEPLAGWLPANAESALAAARAWPKTDVIVTMCACPDDVSAAHVAGLLRKQGYRQAKAMEGGYEAWLASKRLN